MPEELLVFPASFTQERLWFLDQLEPGNPAYNLSRTTFLSGPIDVAALDRSLNEIARRHETLRTTVAMVEEQPVQIVTPVLVLTLPIVDLQALPSSLQEAEVLRLVAGENQRPFNLSRGPLLRSTLLRLDREEHVLLLTMHHIISDGWSMGVFIRELTQLYQAFSNGGRSPLPDLPIQYADFAVWQRQWLQGEVLEKQLAYWKQQLDDNPPPLALPTDHPRPQIQTFRGAAQSLILSKTLTQALRTLSQRQGATLFMILLAAFKVLLHRYTQQQDLCVGSYIANRNRAETEGLIGYFVNTLPLRTDLSGDPTFLELLARVCETTLEAYAHQDVPFEKILEAVQPKRDLSRTPFFQVMLVLQNMPTRIAVDLPGLTLRSIPPDVRRSNFDLTLWAIEVDQALNLELEYSTDLFDATTVTHMLAHLKTLLEGILVDPSRRLSELPILPDEERRQLLAERAKAQTVVPAVACVHHLFEAQAERTPDAVAVAFEAGQDGGSSFLTYRQLDRRANQLAHHLRTLGVGPEVPVGLCVERSPKMLVGILGILKAGGAYLPLDPAYPGERLAFMLEDAGAPVLLTQERLVGALPERQTVVVCLDADWQTVARQSAARLPGEVLAETPVYLIYTSGSTGEPKGAVVQHRSLACFAETAAEDWDVSPQDRILQFATISWDTSAEEIYPCLVRGATLVLRTDAMLDSIGTFLQKCRDWAITLVDLPTAYWHELTTNLIEQDLALPPALHTVIIGGERALRKRLLTWHRHVGGSVRLLNTYGSTETTAITTMCDLPFATIAWQEVPIGQPLRNIQAYVLDRHLQLTPIGAPGELYVGGAGLARGYLNRPALTAERFIPNPCDDEPGGRLYKTGDLVRYLPDGNLEFLGRIDHQVKVRGVRVEPGEIEAALVGHPAIREAVVVAWEHQPGHVRLVAYTVSHQEAPSARELRDFLKTRLPDYWIPATFVTLDALPLTPNGKVDRRALPLPDLARPDLDAVFVAPRTPIEEVLAGIWTEVLGLGQIGVYDDFFELGGHSLLATQVISRVRAAFGVEVALRSLFESSTVAGLAGCIENAMSDEQASQIPPLLPLPRQKGDAYDLSFAQRRLWFVEQLVPGTSAYNIPAALHLQGPLSIDALTRALNTVLQRHQVLRAKFTVVEGQPVQVISDEETVIVPVIDLAAIPAPDRENQARRLVDEGIQHPFNLVTGPLLRATLLRLDEEEHVLVINIHHIVSDDWSIGVFVQEMVALYNAYTAGDSPQLPDLPIQYVDFAHWQRQWLKDEILEGQLAYWKRKLEGRLPVLELPTDHPRPPIQTFKGARLSLQLFKPTSEALKALGHQEQTTLFMTLLAAFQILLHRYTGQDDIVVGSPIAGRNRAEIEGLIGFFVNTLVLRTDLSGNPTFREALRRVRKAALGAYAHQDLPFEKLVEELAPERNLSYNPLFQVMFIVQNAPMPDLELENLTLSPMIIERGTTQFDLILSMVDTEQGLLGTFEYNTDLFEDATIARMAQHFQILLEGIVVHPEQQLSDLTLVSETEWQQIAQWSGTRTDYPRDKCVHELFEAQVEQSPDAVALVFEEEHLTYRELNCRANQLAHYLRELGVEPEVLVGIGVERSLEMVIGTLGILKAGGAYLPLDPDYPQERLAFMLSDANAPVLLTQQRLVERLPGQGVPAWPEENQRVICLDAEWEAIARKSDTNPITLTTADNLAYVMYTSGSTGRPKGTNIVQRSIVRLVKETNYADLTEAEIFLQFAPLSFDASTLELWASLLNGARLVIFAPHTPSLEELGQVVQQHRITTLWLTAGLFHLMVDERLEDLGGLRQLLAGGDVLSPYHVQRVLQTLEECRMINGYGPTENTTFTTCYPMTPDSQVGVPIPIGYPIANTQVYMLDRSLQPVPIGVPGELYIGGDGLARGYLNRPALTAERFLPNPVSDEPGARLYRTGDLARYLPDGSVEFLGRFDYQVKLRGFRVELGEVEAVLVAHPALREAVALVREDAPGDKRLVAYVVPEQDQIPTSGELRDFLQEKVPNYMVPSAFVVLDALPLNPNGKVDRQALPVPEYIRPDSGADFVAPRNEIEEQIAAVWSEVLGIEQIGIDDNFFDLGGESFKAIKVVREVDESFSVVDLFTHPTIRELAELLVLDQPKRDGLLYELTKPIPAKCRVFSLVCIPFAGGSAITYQPLANALPDDYSLYAVELPGHELGRHDEALQSLEEVARQCVEEIKQYVTGPLALYGHCMGGALTIEIARLLEKDGVDIEGIFIGGHFPSPRLPGKFFGWWARTVRWNRWMSRRLHLQTLQVNGFFANLIDSDEQAFVIRNYLHDTEEGEDYYTRVYASPENRKLQAPILCIMADQDRMTEFYEERYREWEFFSDSVDLAVIPRAGHYFVKHQAATVAEIIPNQQTRWRDKAQTLPATTQDAIVAKDDGRSQESEWVRRGERLAAISQRTVAPSLRIFFIVALGQFVSMIGTALTTFALGVWAYQEMGTVLDLSVIFVFALLPGIVVSPLAGTVADRWDRRLVMILSDTAAACGTLALALLLWTGSLQMWHIYAVASIGSIANAFQGPAYLAAITQLVPKQHLGRANGLVQLGGATGTLIAPLLGGVLVVLIGLHGIVLIDFATFLFAVLTLLMVRFPSTLFRRQEEPLLQEVVKGWRFIIKRRGLVAMVVFFVVSNFFSSMLNVLFTPLVLSFTVPAVLGTIMAVNGAGVLLGGLVMGLWGGARRRAEGMVGFVMLYGLSAVLVGVQPVPVYLAVGVFGLGFALALINAHWQTIVQTKVGLELQGRVQSTTQMLVWSMIPLGFLTAGVLADEIFEPLMAEVGPLTTSIGQWIGYGPGRGMGLIVILVGLTMLAWAVIGYRYRPLRFMEDELPDAIPDAVILADKDRLQELADRQLLTEAG